LRLLQLTIVGRKKVHQHVVNQPGFFDNLSKLIFVEYIDLHTHEIEQKEFGVRKDEIRREARSRDASKFLGMNYPAASCGE
jgi:hypothetical protein